MPRPETRPGFAGDYVEAMWRRLQRVMIAIDPRYLRPTEVDLLLGDATKARTKLGWIPRVSFPELVDLMVDSDLALAAREARAAGVSAG